MQRDHSDCLSHSDCSSRLDYSGRSDCSSRLDCSGGSGHVGTAQKKSASTASLTYAHVRHAFDPVYDEHSRILILGSLPSVKSRENHFYYGHPQNRFWKLLAALLHEPVPETIPDKRALLLTHHIAVWDVIAECDIHGSSDASIKNVIPADINQVLAAAPIQQILANGAAAARLYEKYCQPVTGRPAIKCPSTSPANAACSLEKLVEAWGEYVIKPASSCPGR